MEKLLNKLFDKLEDAKMYSPTYSYDVKIANQTIRSFFKDELSKFLQHDVSRRSEQLVCTFCGINLIDEVCKHPKVCSEKKKVKAN